jgi:hypothetical protein
MRGLLAVLAIMVRFLGGGGQASWALIALPSLLKEKSMLSKQIAISGDRLASWLAILSLKNLVVNVQALPSFSVSNLASTIKFIVRVLGFKWYAQDLYWFRQNVPTSSHWWLALLTPLMIKAHSRGYKRARDGGEAPKSLILVVVVVVTRWNSSYVLAWRWGSGFLVLLFVSHFGVVSLSRVRTYVRHVFEGKEPIVSRGRTPPFIGQGGGKPAVASLGRTGGATG